MGRSSCGHAQSAALPDSPVGARRAIVVDNKQDSRLSPGSALSAGITLGACTAVTAAAEREAALPAVTSCTRVSLTGIFHDPQDMERFRPMRTRQPWREAAWVAASKSIKGVEWKRRQPSVRPIRWYSVCDPTACLR